ncbi:MAG: AIR synthase family protein [Gammaproteobacteria bacterium]
MSTQRFPVGKLPAPVLAEVLGRLARTDASVVVGPGIGVDCAVLNTGDALLVCKTDPITFVTENLGHYLVQVNANDLATTGAVPRWLMVTLLLPEAGADRAMVDSIMDQIARACDRIGATLVGGHTEITHGIDRPLAVGCLLGEVAREALVTPRGARPGDRVLLTKGVPIEGTAIIASEFADRLQGQLDQRELETARDFLWHPGISIVRDARVALDSGQVTAMHDPTEGGLLAALWELAQASGRGLSVDLDAVPVPALSAKICRALAIDPLATIASGALLLSVAPGDSDAIRQALDAEGIPCADIGEVREGSARLEAIVAGGTEIVTPPERDEIASLFEARGD